MALNQHTVGHLTAGKTKIYELKNNNNQDFLVTLMPVTGQANLYATVGYAPEDKSKWMYVMDTHSSKRILI